MTHRQLPGDNLDGMDAAGNGERADMNFHRGEVPFRAFETDLKVAGVPSSECQSKHVAEVHSKGFFDPRQERAANQLLFGKLEKALHSRVHFENHVRILINQEGTVRQLLKEFTMGCESRR